MITMFGKVKENLETNKLISKLIFIDTHLVCF